MLGLELYYRYTELVTEQLRELAFDVLVCSIV